MGIPNNTWFWLLDNTEIGKIVNPQHTNDPVEATVEEALRCAEAVYKAKPPKGWVGITCSKRRMKKLLVDFFRQCGGFDTH